MRRRASGGRLIVWGVVSQVAFLPVGATAAPPETASPSAMTETVAPMVTAAPASPVPSDTLITLDFKDADVQNVLRAMAQKGNVNIVTAKGVTGTVTIHLDNVPWETALNVILKTADLGYERDGNVITVMTADDLLRRNQMQKDLTAQEPIVAKVLLLKYLDAVDVQKFLQPQLSPQGRISVLDITGQRGWEFGTSKAGSSASTQELKRHERGNSRSKALLITDTPSSMRRIEAILERVDIRPMQILIEARIMEVDRDFARNIGIDLASGGTGLTTPAGTSLTSPAENITSQALSVKAGAGKAVLQQLGLQTLTGIVTPNIFLPVTSAITTSNTGLRLRYQKLSNTGFDVLVRALEEDSRTNTLSAPSIVTQAGQEASIVVGQKYPILKTQVAGDSTTTTTESLDYYQDIGIQLYVVPQISGDRHIDMIIHPVVSARNGTIGTNQYPILETREAETQMVVEDGETVVLGGLLKDVKSRDRVGLPFLSKIPLLGLLFSRDSNDYQKVDLLIFITAHIVRMEQMTPEEAAAFQEKYNAVIPIEPAAQPALPATPGGPPKATPRPTASSARR